MKVILGMILSQVSATPSGGNDAGGISGGAIPPTWDFAVLILAGLILGFSFFLLYEAIATVKFILPDRPKPESGRELCSATSAWVLLVWCLWVLIWGEGSAHPWESLWQRGFHLLVARPRIFAPGLLLASFLPTAIAMSKLALVVTVRPVANSETQSRPWLTPVVQGGLILLNASASVVTLYKAMHG